MKVLVLGDVHLPWANWQAIEAAAEFDQDYKADVIVQVGDLTEQQAQNRYLKYPDAPSAQQEMDMAVRGARRLSETFDPKTMLWIIEGNHDRRIQMAAWGASLPSQVIRPLTEVFPFENFKFWVEPKKTLSFDHVGYIHGDESDGSTLQKAKDLGRSCVHGHVHKEAEIKYCDLKDRQIFGMNVGTLQDTDSIAARYARKKLLRSWIGWGTVTDGVPMLWPHAKMKRRVRGSLISI